MFAIKVTNRAPSQGDNQTQPKFHLCTLNETTDTKSLPLAFKHLDRDYKYPSAEILCDFSDCAVTENTDEVLRLACCHTFHQECYSLNCSSCPICTKPLLKKITKLADAFNESFLTPTKSSTKTTTNLHNIASEEQQDQEMTPNNSRQSAFYESGE